MNAARVGAAGLGIALLSLHGAAQKSSSELGVLDETAAGAAIGFSLSGNAIGATVGGAIGATVDLISALHSTSTAQKEAADAAKSYESSLNRETGAVTNATRALIAQRLAQSGVLEDLNKVGINSGTFISAIIGNPAAIASVTSELHDLHTQMNATGADAAAVATGTAATTKQWAAGTSAINGAATSYKNLSGPVAAIEQALGAESSGLKQSIASKHLLIQATNQQIGVTAQEASQLDRLGIQSRTTATNTDGMTTATKGVSMALEAATLNQYAFTAAQKASAGALSAAQALTAYKQSLLGLSQALKQASSTPLDIQGNLEGAISAAETYAKTLKDPAARLDYLTKQATPAMVSATERAFGLSKTAARAYLDQLLGIPDHIVTVAQLQKQTAEADLHHLEAIYNLTPKQIATIFKAAGATTAAAEVKALLNYENSLHDKTININTNYTHSGVQTKPYAQGGFYYSAGGLVEHHVAQIAPAGAMRVWAEPETGGEAYIPLAPQKRPRSRAIASETVSRLGGNVIWNADGAVYSVQDLQRMSGLSLTVYGRFMQHLEDDEAAYAAAQNNSTTATKAQTAALNALNAAKARLQQINQYASQATTSTLSTAFSSGNGIGTGPQNASYILQNIIKDTKLFNTYLHRLAQRGANRWVLGQLVSMGPSDETVAFMKQLLTSPTALEQLDRETQTLERLNRQTGTQEGNLGLGGGGTGGGGTGGGTGGTGGGGGVGNPPAGGGQSTGGGGGSAGYGQLIGAVKDVSTRVSHLEGALGRTQVHTVLDNIGQLDGRTTAIADQVARELMAYMQSRNWPRSG